MNIFQRRRLVVVVGLLAVCLIPLAAGCKKSRKKGGPRFVQVERLGRPAVNEGLIVTNDLLNAFNGVGPDGDLAAAAVLGEAAATLAAFGNAPARIGDIVTAFLPDVMRIDTTIASPVGVGAYANLAIPVGALGVVRPVAGRKLEDDVIDITLTVLTGGAITTDNVDYPNPGANPAQGHNLLNGQGVPLGAATFPFLAPAN